ncbi:MAG: DUF934 domain-containing protein [Hydrotalea sp.]|nr:DUF934 domain-containing protein [Hydrotalea sp.]
MWVDLQNGTAVETLSPVATFQTDKTIDEVATQIHNLSEADVVAIEFLTFRDGRGFSLAHLLRREAGFKGKLVALGPVLPDQAQMLYRSGFDLADVGKKKLVDWQSAIKSFSVFYQTAIR